MRRPAITFGNACARVEGLEPRRLLSGGWSTVPTPNSSPYGNNLQSVAAVSASDAWAVGASEEVDDTQAKTLIEHWNGKAWSVVPSPNPGHNSINSGNVLTGVSAVASNNVWAVGYYWQDSLDRTLIEHWNGSSWSVVPSPNQAPGGYNVLYGISARAANDIWAVGYSDNEDQLGMISLVEHWNGSSWSIVSSPNQSTGQSLQSVSALSGGDVWATGSFYDEPTDVWKTLTQHWNGSTWTLVPSPSPGNYLGNVLASVKAISSNNVWAVGSYQSNHGATETLIEHWDGATWSEVPSPNVDTAYGSINVLSGLTAISGNNLWAVGTFAPHTEQNTKPLALHFNGSDWSIVGTPSSGEAAELYGVTSTNGKLFAVGAFSPYGFSYDAGGLIVPQTFAMELLVNSSNSPTPVKIDDLVFA
jgi:hypothetical protein